MNGKILFEWLFWILLSVLMFTLGTGVPLLAPPVMLIAPAPVMLLAKRQGGREAALGVAFSTVLVFMLAGPVSAVMFFFSFGLLGLAFGAISDRAESGVDYVALAILASLTSKIILMSIFMKYAGVNPFAIPPEAADEIVGSVAATLSKGGLSPSQQAIDGYAASMVETVSLLMPSMLILFAAIDTFVTYGVVSRVVKIKNLADLPSFGEWRFPKNIFWALFAALIVDFASRAFPGQRFFAVISANLMEVLRGVFLIEGLSLFWYYMGRKKVNRLLMVGAAAFCVVFSPISYILSMVGIFDIWYDLRKRIRGKRT